MPEIIRLAPPPAERDEPDRRRRGRTTARREYGRLALIKAVADGAPLPPPARARGGHEQTVRAFVTRCAAEGRAGLADRPRPGRPPRLGAADLAAVGARLDEDARTGARTWTLPQAAAWPAEERGVSVTPDHLGARLQRRARRRKRTKRATTHKQPDPDRREDAAAALALVRSCGAAPTWG